MCCGGLQCVAVRCSVLQCAAVCCSALQCVAAYSVSSLVTCDSYVGTAFLLVCGRHVYLYTQCTISRLLKIIGLFCK